MTADNPAYLAPKGTSSIWWQGSVWLQRDSSHWPKVDIQEKDAPEIPPAQDYRIRTQNKRCACSSNQQNQHDIGY